jgi:hypothetical protein
MLNFGSTVWNPCIFGQKEQRNALENIQRRYTKLLPGFYDLSYTDRVNKLKIPFLIESRLINDLAFIHKLVHNKFTGIDNLEFLTYARSKRGHNFKLMKDRCNTGVRENYLTNRIADLWNSLPNATVSNPSTKLFRKKLLNENLAIVRDYVGVKGLITL